MKVRDLTVSDSSNLKGSKEFNHLRVVNLDKFLSDYQNNLDYYNSPFQILADLENQIKFENVPGETLLCAYKPDGDVIFDLVEVKEHNRLRIVVYEYRTTIS